MHTMVRAVLRVELLLGFIHWAVNFVRSVIYCTDGTASFSQLPLKFCHSLSDGHLMNVFKFAKNTGVDSVMTFSTVDLLTPNIADNI